ncbi:hypothetical protein IWX92DRAFT_387769 [Phyllosticta citricarpa]
MVVIQDGANESFVFKCFSAIVLNGRQPERPLYMYMVTPGSRHSEWPETLPSTSFVRQCAFPLTSNPRAIGEGKSKAATWETPSDIRLQTLLNTAEGAYRRYRNPASHSRRPKGNMTRLRREDGMTDAGPRVAASAAGMQAMFPGPGKAATNGHVVMHAVPTGFRTFGMGSVNPPVVTQPRRPARPREQDDSYGRRQGRRQKH